MILKSPNTDKLQIVTLEVATKPSSSIAGSLPRCTGNIGHTEGFVA